MVEEATRNAVLHRLEDGLGVKVVEHVHRRTGEEMAAAPYRSSVVQRSDHAMGSALVGAGDEGLGQGRRSLEVGRDHSFRTAGRAGGVHDVGDRRCIPPGPVSRAPCDPAVERLYQGGIGTPGDDLDGEPFQILRGQDGLERLAVGEQRPAVGIPAIYPISAGGR